MLDKRKLFNALGFIGVGFVGVLVYLNEFAPPDSMLHNFRWKIVGIGLLVIFIHYCIMGADAIIRKKYIWAIALFIAPVPTYWMYFFYYTVFLTSAKNSIQPTPIQPTPKTSAD